MILCNGCKWCDMRCGEHRPDLSYCMNPKTIARVVHSVVDGSTRHYYKAIPKSEGHDFHAFCENMRSDEGLCGPNALLFEPKVDLKVCSDV